MSIAFSKIVKAGNKLREFNFTQASYGLDMSFDIDVVANNEERITFRMVKNTDEQWVLLSHNLPEWLENAQPQLADAINEEIIHNGLPTAKQKHWYHLFR